MCNRWMAWLPSPSQIIALLRDGEPVRTFRISTAPHPGCIRMRNADIVGLFDLVEPGMAVLIEE